MRAILLYLLLLLGVAALSYGCYSTVAASETRRPNILLILTDQQTNDCLSLLGNPNLKTPHMDELARQGVFFTEAYCTTPVCGPSRSSLLTGRMAHETGVVWNTTTISGGLPTLGHIFGQAGYNTAWAGKWHIPEAYPAQTKKDSVGGFKVLPFQSLDKSWELGVHTDGPIADAAVKFLAEYRETKPFLLAVSLHNPHDICWVPRSPGNYAKAEQISDKLPPLPPNFNPMRTDPEPVFLQQKRKMDHYGDELLLTGNYTPADWQAYLYHYYRFTETVDQQIGKVWQALRNRNLDANTIIVFASDHGDGAAAHQWAAKLSLYEEVVTVPFSISWKGHIPQGRVERNQLVSLLDLAPTLCDYAGITDCPRFTGKSLRLAIDRPDVPLREHLVVQLEDDKSDKTRHARMIRDRRFKYNVYNQGARNEQLFDLWNDPGETQNLAYKANYQPTRDKLRKSLAQWMKQTEDHVVLP